MKEEDAGKFEERERKRLMLDKMSLNFIFF
jgi:hypothetical protein